MRLRLHLDAHAQTQRQQPWRGRACCPRPCCWVANRLARPDLWGAGPEDDDVDFIEKSPDSFIVAPFFLNADRDDNMIHFVVDHLGKVAGAVVAACV